MFAGTAALVCALTVAHPDAQERQARAPQTDRTVPVSRGARLSVDNSTGQVVVRTWDKDALRVQARHASRTTINIRSGAGSVQIGASSQNQPGGPVEYEITAPAWMPIKIEGQNTFVTVEGAQSEVSVATVRGDIVIKGGSGSIIGKTIEGEVIVEGARGRINASSVNEGVRISGTTGDITAETTNGSITLTKIESSSVDVATINGDVVYDGAIPDQGRFSITTHNGDIVMSVPEHANVTFSVRTYSGEFNTVVSLKGPDRSEVRRGRRVLYTLGRGGAEVELESFGGAIRLRRGK